MDSKYDKFIEEKSGYETDSFYKKKKMPSLLNTLKILKITTTLCSGTGNLFLHS